MIVKKREVLFSVIIILVMITLGIKICDAITNSAVQAAEKYATAARIEDRSHFRYGMDTNFGSALVYGTVTTSSPVTFPEIGGGYIYIERIDEHYTRHTKIVTWRDAKGQVHHRTEVYYTWDRVNSEYRRAPSILLLGEEFPYGAFELPSERLNLSDAGIENLWGYIYDGADDRSYYNVVPMSLTGTVFANLQNGTITEASRLYRDQTPDEVVAGLLEEADHIAVLFWVIWAVLIVIIVVAFVYAENKWLD